MPLIGRNTFSRDIASFEKGLKKAGRTFKKRGNRVGAIQRRKRLKRQPNHNISNSGKTNLK
eukprot:SAG22_NODE_424_length_10663_cov_93.402026_6_plen_61_part_00